MAETVRLVGNASPVLTTSKQYVSRRASVCTSLVTTTTLCDVSTEFRRERGDVSRFDWTSDSCRYGSEPVAGVGSGQQTLSLAETRQHRPTENGVEAFRDPVVNERGIAD